MKKVTLTKKMLSLVLSFVMVFGLVPVTAFASETYPGKPDGMTVSGSEIVYIDNEKNQEIWLCPNGNGSIVKKEQGDGYIIYEAIPDGGKAFSHWATYYVSDDLFDSFKSSNRYDTKDKQYLFSAEANAGDEYDQYDQTIRVNTSVFNTNGRAYLYAVFVPGVSVSATVENGGAKFDAKNLDHYIGGEYELYVEDAETAHFGVAQGSDLSIAFMTDWYTSIERVVIDNQDQTSVYNESITKASGREYLTLYFKPVTEKIAVQLVTKPRECVIHFHPNADNAGGSMVNQTFQNGTAQTLTKNAFAKEDYMFSGWNTQSDGSGTTYKDGESVTLQTSAYQMDLYAQWKKPLGEFIVPKANDLTYNGVEQELVSAGSSTEGTMMYRLGTGGEFSTVIPKAAFAGDYTVYYYVKGSGAFADSEVQSIPVAIKKLLPTVDMFTSALVGTGKQTTVTVKPDITGMGSVTVEYYSGEQKLDGIPTKPGTYTVKINVEENDKYAAATGLTTEEWGFAISEEDAQAYLCSISEPDYRNGECYWFKGGNVATIIAPQEYMISKDPSDVFSGSVTLTKNDKKTVYLRNDSAIYPVDLSDRISFYESYTVTLDANGGTLKGDSTTETLPVGTITLPVAPTRSGYAFQGWYTAANDGTQVTADTVFEGNATIYAYWTRNSSGGGSSNTTTVTTKNKDGSTTTITSNKTTGVVTETIETADGTTGMVVTDKKGDVTEVSAMVAASAVRSAEKSGEAVRLPIKVEAADDADKAVEIEVDVPIGGARVEIPVDDVTTGTVVVIVNKNDTEEIVKSSTVSEDGVVVTLEKDATVKIVDNSKSFGDVADSFWAGDSIDFVTAREIFGGTSATTFNPNGSMTRQAMWMVLARMSGEAPANMAEAKAWAVESDISDGSNPMNAMTRQQFVTMLWRWAQSQSIDVSAGEDTNILSYEDAFSVSEYAISAVQWACGEGIMGGYTDGTLRPHNTATRAHVATFIQRFYEYVVQ